MVSISNVEISCASLQHATIGLARTLTAPALIYFCINLFLFYLPTEIQAVAGCAVAASRCVNCKQKAMRHCGNPITYARVYVHAPFICSSKQIW